MQRTILIVRHAKSKRPKPGVTDYERTLTKRGIKDARDLAGRLQRQKAWFDQVIASSAPRGRDTATIVIDTLSIPADRVIYDRRLYGATLQRWLAHLRKLDDKTIRQVMLVGHNPEIELLMRKLTGIEGMRTPPAGAIALSFSGSWDSIGRSDKTMPSLKWSYYPKRYFELRPEITMATNAILDSARDTLPRSLDWELCKTVLTETVSTAVGDLFKQHHRKIDVIAAAFDKRAESAQGSGGAKAKPKSTAAKVKPRSKPKPKAKPKAATTAEKLASQATKPSPPASQPSSITPQSGSSESGQDGQDIADEVTKH